LYQRLDPATASQRSGDINNASREIVAIYDRNVFPQLKSPAHTPTIWPSIFTPMANAWLY
jgi:hypothetical protein